jgi:hypothetical protein
VPLNLEIDEVKALGDVLEIKWNKESNQGVSLIPIDFLLNNYPAQPDDSNKRHHLAKVNNY